MKKSGESLIGADSVAEVSEPSEPAALSTSTRTSLIGVVLRSAVTAFFVAAAAVCLLMSAVYIAEGLGPSTTREGVALEVWKSGEDPTGVWIKNQRFARLTLVGEFNNGEQWLIESRDAVAASPAAGTTVEVTTSSITRRVSGFTTPGQPERSWSSTESTETKLFVGVSLLIGVMPAVWTFNDLRARPKIGRPALITTLSYTIGIVGGVYLVWAIAFGPVQ